MNGLKIRKNAREKAVAKRLKSALNIGKYEKNVFQYLNGQNERKKKTKKSVVGPIGKWDRKSTSFF